MMNDALGVLAGGLGPAVAANRDAAAEEVVRLASRARMLAVVHRMAAHDFNDSLNSLTLNVELLARVLDGDVPPEKKAEIERRVITALRQELKRLARTTGGVLDASAQRPETSDRVALSPLVDRVMSELRHTAQRRQVSMVFTPPPTLIEVRGRADDLGLALFNLVLNGIEAMPDGGTLTVVVSVDPTTAVVAITDTGAGIPPEIGAKVWDLYVSTKPEALGVGLAVVKSIAARHDGTVEFEHRETGVTFVMRLPLYQ
jgi:signal transduction histidine kinase